MSKLQRTALNLVNRKDLGIQIPKRHFFRDDELQQFIGYKAKEVGIKVVKVDPRYTSRRCSKCGHIHIEFTRDFRDKYRKEHGKVCHFECPDCEYKDDPDYNAAKNLTVKGIVKLIEKQCKKQGIEIKKKPKEKKKVTQET